MMYEVDVCQRRELRSTSVRNNANGSIEWQRQGASRWLSWFEKRSTSSFKPTSTRAEYLRARLARRLTLWPCREMIGIVADVRIDTDVFIDHLRGAVELRPARHRVHYSEVTRELFAGNTATDLSSRLLAPFRELPIDRAIAERAGRIAREFSVRLPDALIAATAIEHGLSVVTRNRRHFEPPRHSYQVAAIDVRSPGCGRWRFGHVIEVDEPNIGEAGTVGDTRPYVIGVGRLV